MKKLIEAIKRRFGRNKKLKPLTGVVRPPEK